MSHTVKMCVPLGVLLAAMALPAAAVEDQAIPDDALGLSKTSVYDVPDPAVFEYSTKDVGTVGKRAARSYNSAPPMIPHSIEGMVPITREANACKDCHAQPELIGQKLTQGVPVAVPASHYVDLKAGQLYLGRYNCTQCHAPQANVKLLVESTFDRKAKKR
jgi:cytochrome c-type protein NapB